MHRFVWILALMAWSVAALSAGETVVRVTDINAGARGSYPSFLTLFQGQLFFRGNQGLNNVELWRFDGTNASLAAEIVPGPTGSSPANLAGFNGQLYFDATTASGAYLLHRFDGTNVVPLNTNPKAFFGSGGDWRPVAWNNELWFREGGRLYQFNGSRMAYLNNPPWANSMPVLFNGSLYYGAQEMTYGDELWRFNGASQQRVSDINPGAADGYPEVLFVHAGAIFFRARDASFGNELWRYDGGSAQRVADINPGPADSNPSAFVTFRGSLYFAADDGVHGTELFCYDGTSVRLVADINPNPIYEQGGDRLSDSNPRMLTASSDALYFIADNEEYGGLWRYDGTNAVILGGGLLNGVSELILFQNTVYFDADDGIWGRELWKVESNPEPRLAIEKPGANVQVQLQEAETGTYVIEVSSDLKEWSPVSTNRPLDGQIIFSETTNATQRLYRTRKVN